MSHLVKAVVDMAIFLEFGDESLVDPDAAMQAMEQMAAELQCMDAWNRLDFRLQLATLADRYPPEKADFVAGLAEAFGIAD
ncbi:hypothetical protein ACEN9F_00940 [Duganella sp. CT11-25]|uniref:hypothetical protein n=1 Tax=unclassified Duganella TaxID=2636909 RepID=UPI0039AFCE67